MDLAAPGIQRALEMEEMKPVHEGDSTIFYRICERMHRARAWARLLDADDYALVVEDEETILNQLREKGIIPEEHRLLLSAILNAPNGK